MTDAERLAAQKDLQSAVGQSARDITDHLNQALIDGLYADGLPQTLRRLLSTAQIAAVEYGPAPAAG